MDSLYEKTVFDSAQLNKLITAKSKSSKMLSQEVFRRFVYSIAEHLAENLFNSTYLDIVEIHLDGYLYNLSKPDEIITWCKDNGLFEPYDNLANTNNFPAILIDNICEDK